MPNDDRSKIIHRGTPESAAMVTNVKRAMSITARLNRLTFNDAGEIRALFSELIGKQVDESFLLIPPIYTAGGDEIRIGHNVFVNQNCTFYDLGRLEISDDVMIGPNVSIITTGHPLEPSRRRDATIGKPIAVQRNRRDDHRWRDDRRELGRCGGLGGHQECSPKYPRRRKSGAGHSFDWRQLNENLRGPAAVFHCAL